MPDLNMLFLSRLRLKAKNKKMVCALAANDMVA